MAEPIKVIGDILTSELSLPVGQVMFGYERFDIPQTNGLYIALYSIGGKAIANNNYFDGNTLMETQQVTILEQIQIDIMSFDPSARMRKEEVYQALRGIFAEQAMEANQMQIARMPSAFIDAASFEETKFLNRFTMTIAVTAMFTKVKAATSYYDQFPTPEVHVNE